MARIEDRVVAAPAGRRLDEKRAQLLIAASRPGLSRMDLLRALGLEAGGAYPDDIYARYRADGMTMPEHFARYAQDHGTWFIKLGGDLRYSMAPALNALLDRAFEAEDTYRFYVDLTEAEKIDSTCLGVLVRIANWSREQDKPRPIIVTTEAAVTSTLLGVCFDRLFELRGEPVGEVGNLADLTEQGDGAGAFADLVLDAHRRLSEIDAANAEAFREVIDILERDIQQRRRIPVNEP